MYVSELIRRLLRDPSIMKYDGVMEKKDKWRENWRYSRKVNHNVLNTRIY